MITILAFRHLLVKKGRSLFLLLGYGLGVGVMIVLLSVGQAMLEQSQDVSLVGGGELTVLPQGIDVEAMRTGGVSGMFFGIARARFLTRQLLGGARHAARVAAVSPALENKLVYLRHGERSVVARAGGEIPSRAAALGAGLDLRAGRWADHAADSAWLAPTPGQLYDELDRFHLPATPDSMWGEWHYFNVAAGPDEWWYITYLVGGAVPTGRWGGQLLVTHRQPGGRYTRYSASFPSDSVVFDTTRADLTLGGNTVRQADGRYTLEAASRGPGGALRLSLTVVPAPHRFFPPVELREGASPSGYVVPALAATASGRICVGARCTTLAGAPAYHDHNWGVWRNVTWDWGAASGARFNVLYGAVYAPEDTLTRTGAPPIFVALVDSLGVRQILRSHVVRYDGRLPGRGGVAVPARFEFLAARDADTLRVRATILDAQATRMGAGAMGRSFLQMRGRFTLEGTVAGAAVADSGMGFFETYVE
ncbi:MAG: hypothetical protein IPJ57_08785 [Gemmatimonadetes bacterium]|nr:hypothetical protein [Gemmatimonadota bacterium]